MSARQDTVFEPRVYLSPSDSFENGSGYSHFRLNWSYSDGLPLVMASSLNMPLTLIFISEFGTISSFLPAGHVLVGSVMSWVLPCSSRTLRLIETLVLPLCGLSLSSVMVWKPLAPMASTGVDQCSPDQQHGEQGGDYAPDRLHNSVQPLRLREPIQHVLPLIPHDMFGHTILCP